jgi:hypothetical protein
VYLLKNKLFQKVLITILKLKIKKMSIPIAIISSTVEEDDDNKQQFHINLEELEQILLDEKYADKKVKVVEELYKLKFAGLRCQCGWRISNWQIVHVEFLPEIPQMANPTESRRSGRCRLAFSRECSTLGRVQLARRRRSRHGRNPGLAGAIFAAKSEWRRTLSSFSWTLKEFLTISAR